MNEILSAKIPCQKWLLTVGEVQTHWYFTRVIEIEKAVHKNWGKQCAKQAKITLFHMCKDGRGPGPGPGQNGGRTKTWHANCSEQLSRFQSSTPATSNEPYKQICPRHLVAKAVPMNCKVFARTRHRNKWHVHAGVTGGGARLAGFQLESEIPQDSSWSVW